MLNSPSKRVIRQKKHGVPSPACGAPLVPELQSDIAQPHSSTETYSRQHAVKTDLKDGRKNHIKLGAKTIDKQSRKSPASSVSDQLPATERKYCYKLLLQKLC